MDQTRKKERRKFDETFKVNAVKLALSTERPVSHVARELGIAANRLYHWKQDYLHLQGSAFPGQGKLTKEDEEHRKFIRRIAELEEENAILKKAMGYFAVKK
jgi:transposase